MSKKPKIRQKLQIGVLDIQGSVEEHLAVLAKMGADAIGVKNKKDLARVSGLIIPGGESTTIGKLLKMYGLDAEICKRTRLPACYSPLAIWGTCAGAILLAKKVTGGQKGAPPRRGINKIAELRLGLPDILGLMDIEIARNAYGRQLDSFETEISVSILGAKKFPAVFIRAPVIKKASQKAEILAKYNGHPVMLRQNNLLATTFHPELTDDTRIHEYFIKMTREYAK